jgi:hypothetical protein
MHSRREFLQAGIAASIVPIAMPAHAIACGTAATRIVPSDDQFFAIVYDVRFDEAALLASNAERAGLPVTRIAGDITDFWVNELSLQWKSRASADPVSQTRSRTGIKPVCQTAPVAIAGLTAHGPLFCLERLGWDHGMRVAFRSVHRVRGGRLPPPLKLWRTTEAFGEGGQAAHPDGPSASEHDELLSWVITPKARG